MILSPAGLRSAAANVTAKLLYGQVADLRRTPADRIEGTSRSPVYRYRPPEGLVPAGPPVLFVPSPGAPARCYDLRRGGSLAEHVVGAGRLTYLLDHRRAGPPDPGEALAEWVGEILPSAVRRVSDDAGGQPVQLVGWCLGGVLALLSAAVDPGLPIASVAAIAPVTVDRRTAVLPTLTGGLLRTTAVLARIDDRDHLAHLEAVDHFAATSAVHPGRGLNETYAAHIQDIGLPGALHRVAVPVLAIAGSGDRAAPAKAVRALTLRLRSAPQVRFEIAPGDHLGVLTGRAARATTWAHLDRWLDEGIIRHGIRPHRREVAAGL
ncbi:alpha/beta hydrolase [Thermomonospora umbrina]|uniref:Polyhydroxyalkanoate synthase n=1 Tax=Thermomonospora umbrina TaxID=111806 RepID=A0A3D9SRY4_9ACTN|nr:alpha/beta hydrolase [Thermomonospora umbrina]REE95374.1 polyhydroxyalkanoate synthase [Thermomonospora umbrina]